jgi:crotonobetainyl-CoA:carnitine CoA-transferase CaiB-like acyl-CoA transferase
MSGDSAGALETGVPSVVPAGGPPLTERHPYSGERPRVSVSQGGGPPLAGLRVLDLGRGDAAGACARLLAQLGAHVESVAAAELAGPGLDTAAERAVPAPGAARDGAPPVPREHHPRRDQVTPRVSATGRHRTYDLVVSDLRPTEAAALGLAPACLADWAPVVVSATTYGLDGPDADRAGPLPAAMSFDLDVDAALAGAHAAAAALAALRWSRHTGRGVVVEVATVEVVAACLGDRVPCRRAAAGGAAAHPAAESAQHRAGVSMEHPAAESVGRRGQASGGRPRQGPGGRSGQAPGVALPAASNTSLLVLPCADGYVGFSAAAAASRADLAALTDLPAVADPAVPLGEALGPWLRVRTRAEVFHAAQLWRLPVVPTLDPAEVPVDAQSVARDCWQEQDGRLVPRSPFRYTWTTRTGDGLCSEAQGCPFLPLPLEAQWPPRFHRPESDGTEDGAAAAPRGPVGGANTGPASRLPLTDLRVLDLGMVWAGPYCGRLLAGLGATVIKVEGPRRKDGTRAGGRGDCTGVFGDLNRGKASLVVDLASRAGRDSFLRLARGADVVLENYSPRVMPNFGLDYAALARANPRLLMLSLPAFGGSGPSRDYVAYGSGLELATGLAARAADGRPVPAPVAYLDYLAGAYGAVGLLAALLARDRGGGGAPGAGARQEVDRRDLGAEQVGSQILGAHLELAQREVASQVLGAIGERQDARPPAALDPAALAADPHLAARGLFAPPTRAGRACHHYARLPWRLREC